MQKLLPCLCGCGQLRPERDSQYRKRRFIDGHYPRVQPRLTGPNSPKWKGGRTRTNNGYIMLTLSDGSRQLEHRHVMETLLGRRLTKNEAVHHKNGVRDDNRLENLEVLSVSHHPQIHRHNGKIFPMEERKCYDCGGQTEGDWYTVTSIEGQFRCKKCHKRLYRRKRREAGLSYS